MAAGGFREEGRDSSLGPVPVELCTSGAGNLALLPWGQGAGRQEVITREQIEGAGPGAADALALVRRFHPEWLRQPGSGGMLRTQDVQVGLENHLVVVQTQSPGPWRRTSL